MLQGIFSNKWMGAALGSLAVLSPLQSAQAVEGQPSDWGFNLQDAASPISEQIHGFHNFIFVIIALITLFVLALLIICVVRFNEKSNPTPSKNAHNTLLEVAWTVIPILILLAIAIPSFRLLFAQYDFPKADLTIKAIGNQWYWSYEYPDQDEMAFDSIMLEDDEVKEAQEAGRVAPRLLAVDNAIVVPVNKVVHVLVTSADVIHNWTVPAFGSKIDAVPGRVTRTWFKATKTGTYFGQCSELCGVRHAFMPIEVRVVSDAEYEEWLVKAKEEFASKDSDTKTAKAKAAPVREEAGQEIAGLAD